MGALWVPKIGSLFMATYMATYGNHGKLNPQKLNIYNTCNYVTTYVKRFHLEPELHFLQKGFFNGAKFGELKKPNEVRRLKKTGVSSSMVDVPLPCWTTGEFSPFYRDIPSGKPTKNYRKSWENPWENHGKMGIYMERSTIL